MLPFPNRSFLRLLASLSQGRPGASYAPTSKHRAGRQDPKDNRRKIARKRKAANAMRKHNRKR